MKRMLIKPDLCQSCDVCGIIENCEFTAAIREEKDDMPVIDMYRCSGCEKCLLLGFCPHKAIEIMRHPCDGKRTMGW